MNNVFAAFFALMVAAQPVAASASEVESSAAFMAEAKASTKLVEKKLPVVGKYLEQTYLCLELCRLKMVIGSSAVGESVVECIEDGREITTSLFKKAMPASKNKNIRQALKDHHLAFVAALNGIRPEPEELKIDYDRRQTMLRGGFLKTLARFDVELY